jgi:hypothetical protein
MRIWFYSSYSLFLKKRGKGKGMKFFKDAMNHEDNYQVKESPKS